MLAILTTHPIQYQVPLWQALARDGRVPFEVWYLSDAGARPRRDREFGQTFVWDIDLLSGYPHRFLLNAERAAPGSFWSCRLHESIGDRLKGSGAMALWMQGWQVAAYWQAAYQAYAANVDVWLRGESNDLLPVPAWKRPPKRLALGLLFTHVDRFLYIGTANKRLYRGYGVPEARLYPSPYAVDNERFARQAEALRPQRPDLRRQWGIEDDAFCILFCGKFIAKKRPLDLVLAAEMLSRREPRLKLHLLFAGSGELGGALRDACDVVCEAENGVKAQAGEVGRVKASFVGFLNQTEISRAYVAADCLVLPSGHGETWGLVVNEALASGLSCVVSDACGCAEEFAVPAARAYPMGDVSALAARLKALAERPVGGCACAQAIAGHSFSATVETVASIWAARTTTH